MKKVSTAYLLWVLLGAHYFYLDKPLKQFLFYLTLGGLGIWAIVDLFRIKGMVERYNQENGKG